MLLRKALKLIGAGVVLGSVGAVAGGRWLSTMVFEVSPHDPATLLGSAVLLAVAGLLASYLQARQATRVDPALVLHSE